MRHDDIWRALDSLAAEHGLSASGLAKRAGLDPTAFNPSKRIGPDGRARWPSTESVAKVLAATGTGIEGFAALVAGAASGGGGGAGAGGGAPGGGAGAGGGPQRRIPLIGFAQAGGQGYFDDGGFPAGAGWDEIALPDVSDPNAYGLEISGESMQPVYRDGDIVVVSPAAPVRRGDRVVVRTRAGEVMAKELRRQSARRVELGSLNPAHTDYSFELADLAWMHRIVWASQ